MIQVQAGLEIEESRPPFLRHQDIAAVADVEMNDVPPVHGMDQRLEPAEETCIHHCGPCLPQRGAWYIPIPESMGINPEWGLWDPLNAIEPGEGPALPPHKQTAPGFPNQACAGREVLYHPLAAAARHEIYIRIRPPASSQNPAPRAAEIHSGERRLHAASSIRCFGLVKHPPQKIGKRLRIFPEIHGNAHYRKIRRELERFGDARIIFLRR